MPRHATEPRYYGSRGGYFTTIKGALIPLANGPEGGATLEAAWEAFRQAHATNPRNFSDHTELYPVLQAYLAWVRDNLEPATLRLRRNYLKSFHESYGRNTVADLKRHHVQKWLDANTGWNGSTRAAAVRSLKTALNWAVGQDLITKNPIAGFRNVGTVAARITLLTKDQHLALLAYFNRRRTGRAMVGLLEVLWETGARPGEIARATAGDVDWEQRAVILSKHKTVRKTGAPRVIYLNPRAFEVVQAAAEEHPTGPLFPGRKGQVLGVSTLARRVRKARERLGLPDEITPYSYRHTYVTDWLLTNQPVTTLAKLLGTSVLVIDRHYNHVSRHVDALRSAVDGFAGAR